jgi:tRNA (guanine37-N1)-methyltransferase
MRIDIVTIFPDYLAPLHESLIGKAITDGIIDLAVHDLRDWTTDVHHTVDDSPYGGGPGMVMRPDIWGRALDAVTGAPWVDTQASTGTEMDTEYDATPGGRPILIIPTPSGQRFDQAVAEELAAARHLVFACGRYEGIDGRVAADAARRMPVRQLSIGDYVLAGGEVAVLVMVEAIGRLLPGVLGNADSAHDDSFADGVAGLLEGPVYTRPATYRGLDVPPVLLSGHHALIARAERDESLRRTAAHRPDLLAALTADDCDERDLDVLTEIGATPPDGLAERVAAERAAREKKRRRGHRHA